MNHSIGISKHGLKKSFAVRIMLLAFCVFVFSALLVSSRVIMTAYACPFCSAVGQTFAEQIDASDIAVVATLIEEASSPDELTLPRGKFQVVQVLKGEDVIPSDTEFSAIVVNRSYRVGDLFFLLGNGSSEANWTTPLKVTDRVVDYLENLHTLPPKGPQRLEFFVRYLEDPETVLAFDAYDEFARAPYEDVIALKEILDREQLIAWLKDPEVLKNRKRLYYTLLGICGTEKEIEFLEDIIRSGDRHRQTGLDALIGCYLTLKGNDGIDLITETFLTDPNVEYLDVFSVIQALRFHGTETDVVDKELILGALRHVLDRPAMADLVIPDLARWEDWSAVEKLATIFREATTEETSWVRTPIISYLEACPHEKAKQYLAEFCEMDPDAAARARMMAEIDWDDEEDDWGEEEEEEEEGTEENLEDDSAADPQPVESSEKQSSWNDWKGNVLLSSSSWLLLPVGIKRTHVIAEKACVCRPSIRSHSSSARQTQSTPVSNDTDASVDDNEQPADLVLTGPKTSESESGGHFVSTIRAPRSTMPPHGNAPATAIDQNSLLPTVPGGETAAYADGSPLAVSNTTFFLTVFSICTLLFLLLWSVLIGWFERLIF